MPIARWNWRYHASWGGCRRHRLAELADSLGPVTRKFECVVSCGAESSASSSARSWNGSRVVDVRTPSWATAAHLDDRRSATDPPSRRRRARPASSRWLSSLDLGEQPAPGCVVSATSMKFHRPGSHGQPSQVHRRSEGDSPRQLAASGAPRRTAAAVWRAPAVQIGPGGVVADAGAP